MTWGLHDGIEFEKHGRPAVTIITGGFIEAADERATVLGLVDHPRVVTDHPLASRTRGEIDDMVARAVDEVVRALVKR